MVRQRSTGSEQCLPNYPKLALDHGSSIHNYILVLSSWCLRTGSCCVCRSPHITTQECQQSGSLYLYVAGELFCTELHISGYNTRLQAFDAMIHFSFEGSWLFLSVLGRQVNTSTGPFAEMCTSSKIAPHLLASQRVILGREYAAADYRWGVADPTVVSLELLTVLGAGPLCCYILKQLVSDDPARHYWIVVLSTAEIYGG